MPLKPASEHKVFFHCLLHSLLLFTSLGAFNHEAEGGMGMEGLVSVSIQI